MARVRVAAFVLCLFGALGAVAPALAAAGSIAGTVTAAVGGAPVAGIQVCARVEPLAFEETCAETDAGGGYALAGLPSGSYKVRFSERQNRNYVDQFFSGKSEFSTADPIAIAATENKTGVDAALQAGGTIAGTVTDFGTGIAVANFPVCAFASTPLGEVGRCWRTDGDGNYAINGLPPEDYEVEFLGEGEFNYLTQYYDGATTAATATPVPIAGPGDLESSIDAALRPGAEISGTLTAAGTHKPLSGVEVSLLAPVTEEVLKFVETDSAGRYAFRGRPAGTYVIGFSHTMFGSFNSDCYQAQYYRGAAGFASATPLTVAPPDVLAGIDGEVTDICPKTGPQPVQVTLIPTAPQPRPFKCRKGKRKKWVKGRYHCVKKKHHRRGGKHGPHAVASGR